MFHPLPRMIIFSNFFITLPKPFQLSLGVAGKRNTDFVSFVTILPIFAAKRPDYRGDARWQPLKERTLNIPLFKEDFCSNIQGKQGGKLFGKSWKKISHQNEVETRLVQVDSRVYCRFESVLIDSRKCFSMRMCMNRNG